ncbi:MAG: bifunctional DNA-formamidopyrimidine glycosylase/DNA-(apurinic or apyrimidinic site) lyase [Sphaerochaetaceae bacterium]|nr:bifunctional DNA-formamidopyrimidine glycosylase/DNA-(apurinic or apyrimidinic site) lyase [Sphaerochaetaceae bacterium]
MPELPEVESIRRFLSSSGFMTQKVETLLVHHERSFRNESGSELEGAAFTSITRKGKKLFIHLDDGRVLVVHFSMSGTFSLTSSPGPDDIHDRVIFTAGDLRLAFHDPRRFGTIILTDDDSLIRGRLGIDALSSTLSKETLAFLLGEKKRAIKSVLLDQSIISGLGNIYVDEILWAAGIHPLIQASEVPLPSLYLLHSQMRRILMASISLGGTSLGDGESNYHAGGVRGGYYPYLKVFDRDSERCERCSSVIGKIRVAQRGTHYCPSCQPFT